MQVTAVWLVRCATRKRGHGLRLSSSCASSIRPRPRLTYWKIPDGKYIGTLHHDGYQIALYEVTTGKWQEMGQPGTGSPSWSRDSRYTYFDSVQSVFFRLRISDKKLERVVGLENINRVEDAWVGLGPDDSPLIVREIGSQEIYALDVEFP